MAEVERRQPLGADAALPGSFPRRPHERSHLLQTAIIEVPCDELFVRALDEKARDLG
ncbi:hypothetical protein GCM10010455_17320 [Microbacterium esteraromaticum]